MLAHGASRGTIVRNRAGKPQRGDTCRHAATDPTMTRPSNVSPLRGFRAAARPLSHGWRRGLACCAPTGLTVSVHPIDRDRLTSFPPHSTCWRGVDTNGRETVAQHGATVTRPSHSTSTTPFVPLGRATQTRYDSRAFQSPSTEAAKFNLSPGDFPCIIGRLSVRSALGLMLVVFRNHCEGISMVSPLLPALVVTSHSRRRLSWPVAHCAPARSSP